MVLLPERVVFLYSLSMVHERCAWEAWLTRYGAHDCVSHPLKGWTLPFGQAWPVQRAAGRPSMAVSALSGVAIHAYFIILYHCLVQVVWVAIF